MPWRAMLWPGGFWATTREGREVPPWKRENEDTATSPCSGDKGFEWISSFGSVIYLVSQSLLAVETAESGMV
jgi:hypothetical protein